MTVELKKIAEADAPLWLELQIEANKEYLDKYQDYDVNPACETLERVVRRINSEWSEHFFIVRDGEVVGGIRSWFSGAGRYRLGGMFIVPRFQNLGIGFEAVLLLEGLYPNAASWELDTIQQEARLLHFYGKLGYKQTDEVTVVNDKMSLVFMKKIISTPKILGVYIYQQ